MKNKKVYYCLTDLKALRVSNHLTAEQLAKNTFCTSRTINRIEAKNRTSNFEIAKAISKEFSYDVNQLFVDVDAAPIDSFGQFFKFTPSAVILPKTSYFLLYARRVSFLEVSVWAKTYWIKNHDSHYQVRRLSKLSDEGIAACQNEGLPVINSPKEWTDFLFSRTIGKTQKIVISEPCARDCISYVLKDYAVDRKVLDKCGIPDVILLGDYKG